MRWTSRPGNRRRRGGVHFGAKGPARGGRLKSRSEEAEIGAATRTLDRWSRPFLLSRRGDAGVSRPVGPRCRPEAGAPSRRAVTRMGLTRFAALRAACRSEDRRSRPVLLSRRGDAVVSRPVGPRCRPEAGAPSRRAVTRMGLTRFAALRAAVPAEAGPVLPVGAPGRCAMRTLPPALHRSKSGCGSTHPSASMSSKAAPEPAM